jgi:hypothetical protein
MRTVTFSDPKVAALVNTHFVAAWHNRGPGFHNEDYSTEEWIYSSQMEAYPTKNICTFFLAPDGRVFHYVAGYFAPERFAAELEQAVALRRAAFDEGMQLKAGGLAALKYLHGAEGRSIRARLSSTAVEDLVAAIQPRPYRSFTHRHGPGCAKSVREGEAYLAALHDHWSRVEALPDLEAVRYDYLYGNSFTEEKRRAGTPAIAGRSIGN